MASLTDAIKTRAGYLANELAAGDTAAASVHANKIIEFANRIVVGIAPASAVAKAEVVDESEWSGTWAEAYARWLDAADEVLIAAGKPAGRDGAERGAMNREESIALAKKIGVFDELDGLWGPETPGASL